MGFRMSIVENESLKELSKSAIVFSKVIYIVVSKF